MPIVFYITCRECGREHDMSKKGGYYENDLYVCKRCARKLARDKKAEAKAAAGKSR